MIPATLALTLSGDRLANATIILEEFRAAGLPDGLALAAIVNADAESRLNARAIGDKGKSVGLFQLHEAGGGRGMSTAERQDPRLNTRRIIQEYKAARAKTVYLDSATDQRIAAESIDAAMARGATVAEVAGLWAAYVERPFAAQAERIARAARAYVVVPLLAGQTANRVGSQPSAPPSVSTPGISTRVKTIAAWTAVSIAIILAAGAVALRRRV